MQETERANALLGRYFAPDVRDEIVQSEIDLVEQEPRDLEVAWLIDFSVVSIFQGDFCVLYLIEK